MGIICAAANGMGLLSSYGPQDWHPVVQEIKDVCTEAREYCKVTYKACPYIFLQPFLTEISLPQS